MDRTLIVSLGLLLSISIFSQERVNREKNSFISESKKITKAKGWYYNEDNGVWIDNNNFICFENPNLLEVKYYKSKSEDNFNWFQFKKIEYKSRIYYVLIINCSWGYYQYPYINEGWNIAITNWAYVYDEENYNKLKSDDKEVMLAASSFNSFRKGDGLDRILFECKQIEKHNKKPYYKHFPIILKVENNDLVVRFLLPNNSNSSFDLLSKKYYEMKKDDFMKILID